MLGDTKYDRTKDYTQRIEQVTMLVAIDKDAYPDKTLDLIMEIGMKHPQIVDQIQVIDCSVEPLELYNKSGQVFKPINNLT